MRAAGLDAYCDRLPHFRNRLLGDMARGEIIAKNVVLQGAAGLEFVQRLSARAETENLGHTESE